MKRPLGNERLENIASMVCREFGYLCFSEEKMRDALPLVASELAILETYDFLSRAQGDRKDKGYELILACLEDDKCLETLLDTVNSAVDIYLNGEDYFFSLDQEELERAIRVAETVASIIEKDTSQARRDKESHSASKEASS